MSGSINLLDQVRIASPCTASWAAMKGDDRMRHCEQCSLHVYNLSEMDHAEAESLIRSTEGHVCVRLYRRRDGTTLTRDCPIGLAAVRRRLARGLTTISAALWAVLCAAFSLAGAPRLGSRLREIEPFQRVCNWLAPPAFPKGGFVIMGDMVALPPTGKVKASGE